MTEQEQNAQHLAEDNGMNKDLYMPERVVVIVAHCDDIEFGMAGTIARWTDAGAHVTYCIVTDSSSGSNEPNADLEELIETRQQEQIAAAKMLGVHDVRFLNYPDGTLQPTLELRRDLTRIIREIRPNVVMTLDPRTIIVETNNYINHPDHRAVGEAALYATFPSAETRPIFPELLAEGLEPHKVNRLFLTLSMQRNTAVDITTTIDRKIASLGQHKSQVGEDALEMVRKWSKEGGERNGFGYAEEFQVITLNIPDEEQEPQQETAAERGA